MSEDLDLDLENGGAEENQNPPSPKNEPARNPKLKDTTQQGGAENEKLLKEIARLKGELEKKKEPEKDINAIVAAEVAKALRAQNVNPVPAAATGAELGADDYDENGKYYFSYRYATALTGYRYEGKTCDNPVANINPETKKPDATVFLYMGHKTNKVGDIRESESIVLCHYCSRSKAEQKWIENHPEFRGGIIFTDHRTATSATAKTASRAAIAARIYNSVSTWSAPKIAATAPTYGVTVSTDAERMRMEIVDKMVDAEIAQAQGLSERIAKDASREGLFQTGDEGSFATRKTHATA